MLRVCLRCATEYAADLLKCPHCLHEKFRWNHEEPPAPPAVPAAAAAPPVPAAADGGAG